MAALLLGHLPFHVRTHKRIGTKTSFALQRCCNLCISKIQFVCRFRITISSNNNQIANHLGTQGFGRLSFRN